MTALPPSGSFAMVDPQWVAAVGPAAAILYARIQWRSQETGSWPASRRVLMAETGLSEQMLRTAVRVLRDHEWVTTTRCSSDDATLVWRPVLAGQTDMVESTPPDGGINTTPPVESTISSYETSNTPPSSPPELFVVPAQTPAPKPAKAPRRACQLPSDFRPQPSHWELAASLGVNLTEEGPRFVDHHLARGSTFKDWNRALNTWIRNAAKFARERGAAPEPPKAGPSAAEVAEWQARRERERAELDAMYAQGHQPVRWGSA